MPAAPISYRKLPGRGYGFGESSRLYLAEDHLMLVTAVGFHETYRRFYFRDIQAITLRRTSTRLILNFLIGFHLAMCVAGVGVGMSRISQGGTLGENAIGLWIFGCMAILFLTLVIINNVRGPTCACEIHTAVQMRALGPMNRIRSARKTLARLRPLIETAQGTVPADELRARLDQARQYFAPGEAPPIIGSAGS